MAFANLGCITSKIDITNSCTADQSAVEFFFDDNGLSLSTVSKTADERYVKGQTLVDAKVRIALDDVMSWLMRNTTSSCDLDETDGIICDNDTRIARAVWYKATALLFKEIALDSKRYNDIIHYAGEDALAQMVYYDSKLKVFTTLEKVPAGKFQIEMQRLETVRRRIEEVCCVDCVGTRWTLTLP